MFLVISVDVWLHPPPLARQAVRNRLAHRGATRLRSDSKNYHAKRHRTTKTLSRRWLRNRSQCRILHSTTPGSLQKRQIPLWIVLENTTGSEMHVGGIRGMTSVRIVTVVGSFVHSKRRTRFLREPGLKMISSSTTTVLTVSWTGHIPALGKCLIFHMYVTCWLPLPNQ